MKRNLKKIIISATAILILTGCNVEQTFNDTIDGAGRVLTQKITINLHNVMCMRMQKKSFGEIYLPHQVQYFQLLVPKM